MTDYDHLPDTWGDDLSKSELRARIDTLTAQLAWVRHCADAEDERTEPARDVVRDALAGEFADYGDSEDGSGLVDPIFDALDAAGWGVIRKDVRDELQARLDAVTADLNEVIEEREELQDRLDDMLSMIERFVGRLMDARRVLSADSPPEAR